MLTDREDGYSIQGIFAKIKDAMNAPLYAALITILLNLVPFAKNGLIDQDNFFHRLLVQPAKSVGKGVTPLLLLILGANLANTKIEEGRLNPKSIMAVTAIKLLIMPMFGGLFSSVFIWMNLMQDPTMIFLTILNYSLPTAINILMLVSTYGNGDLEKETSKLLFVGYVSCLFTLPVVLYAFFSYYTT